IVRIKQYFETFEVKRGTMKELTRKEEQVLLAVHHLQGEAYLITIREQIFRYTGTRYSVGTIYAPLNRLNINGYIEAYTNRNPEFSSKKPIRFYRLTRKGRVALVELQKAYSRLWTEFVAPAEEKT
ncbi:MAG TPA: helix-turn-helix transcriptional regulator, partial [Candidatus Binatia bacterium]|nr:helix-turn-helix transcriptional regulator [Candidatus Binatia bacterium]